MNRPLTLSSILAGVALNALSLPAIAQQSSPVTEIDEVIVTGTRQDTRLADAPIATTVLTRQFIEDARISTLRQIDDFEPPRVSRRLFGLSYAAMGTSSMAA